MFLIDSDSIRQHRTASTLDRDTDDGPTRGIPNAKTFAEFAIDSVLSGFSLIAGWRVFK
jgi:hypothetical protein